MTFRTWLVSMVALSVWLAGTVAFAEDLSLDQVKVRVRVSENLARTKMVLLVKNHSDDPQEAHVDLALPTNASVTRLSLDLGSGEKLGQLRGRLIEREQASKVYQEIVDRSQDPAILEDQGQGDYLLRVFPVPVQGTQRVVIEYEHLLPQLEETASYVFEPPSVREGAKTIRRFSLSVNGVTQRYKQLSSASPFSVPLARPILASPRVRYANHQGQTYFRVELVPEVQAPLREYGGLVLAIEAPLSSTDAHAAAMTEARVIANELSHLPIEIVQNTEAGEMCKEGMCVQKIALGESRFQALLRRASRRAEAMPGAVALVVIGEGRELGPRDDGLLGFARALPHSQTLHLLGMESPRRRFLSRLANTGRGHYGSDANTLLRLIAQPLVTGLRVESRFGAVEGVSRRVELSRQGQTITFYGRLTEEHATLSVRARVGEMFYLQQIDLVRPKKARSSSLVRAWIRQAPVEVTREVSGVDVLRAENAFLAASRAERRIARAPRVILSCGGYRPSGSVDGRTIRRRVRLANNKVRHCYNRALIRDPSAEGTVVAQWTITAEGSVTNASVAGDVGDGELNACIAKVHQNIRYPQATDGGVVNVRYPYVLRSPEGR